MFKLSSEREEFWRYKRQRSKEKENYHPNKGVQKQLFSKLRDNQSSEKIIVRPSSQTNSNLIKAKTDRKRSRPTPVNYEVCDTGASVEEYEETCNSTNYASNQYLSTQTNEMRGSKGEITRSNSSYFSSKGQDKTYFRSPKEDEVKLHFIDEEEQKQELQTVKSVSSFSDCSSIREGSVLVQNLPEFKIHQNRPNTNVLMKINPYQRSKAKEDIIDLEDDIEEDVGLKEIKILDKEKVKKVEKQRNDHIKKMKQLLLYAIENSDMKLITNHIMNGNVFPFDINFKAEDQFTPLHLAVSEGNEEMVRFFLQKNAEVNVQALNKRTPLQLACIRGHFGIVKLLIERGALIKEVDAEENNAVHLSSLYGNQTILQYLLQQWNDPMIYLKNSQGKTPIDLAQNTNILLIFEKFIYQLKSKAAKNQKLNNFISMFSNGPRTVVHRQSHTKVQVQECYDNSSDKIGPHSFIPIQLLGKGAFGKVYLVQKIDTKKLYAMKVLKKKQLMGKNLVRYALTERNVLTYTNHPFIVRLDFAFQTAKKLVLVLEYCPGGDLGKAIQKVKKFSERASRQYLAEVLLALEDLHKKDIIFRDLKPDNIVIDKDGHALLTDFGLSKTGIFNDTYTKTFCGSVAYLAPEMLKRQGHGKAVDWYLLGVLLYEMLVGQPPYFASNKQQLFQNIQTAPLKVPSYLSTESKSLLKGVSYLIQLLNRNPSRRLGGGCRDAEEIKEHEFFKDIDWKAVFHKKVPVSKPIIQPIMPQVIEAKIFRDSLTEENKIPNWTFVNGN